MAAMILMIKFLITHNYTVKSLMLAADCDLTALLKYLRFLLEYIKAFRPFSSSTHIIMSDISA